MSISLYGGEYYVTLELLLFVRNFEAVLTCFCKRVNYFLCEYDNMNLLNNYRGSEINEEEYLRQYWPDELLTLQGGHRVRPRLEGSVMSQPNRGRAWRLVIMDRATASRQDKASWQESGKLSG